MILAHRYAAWPGLHNEMIRMAPAVEQATPCAATFNLDWLSAAGTTCALATFFGALILKFPMGTMWKLLGSVLQQLGFSCLLLPPLSGWPF